MFRMVNSYVMYILPQKLMYKGFLCHARTFKEGNNINTDGFRHGWVELSLEAFVKVSPFSTPPLSFTHSSQLPSLVLVFSFLNKNHIFEKSGFSF